MEYKDITEVLEVFLTTDGSGRRGGGDSRDHHCLMWCRKSRWSLERLVDLLVVAVDRTVDGHLSCARCHRSSCCCSRMTQVGKTEIGDRRCTQSREGIGSQRKTLVSNCQSWSKDRAVFRSGSQRGGLVLHKCCVEWIP